MQKSTLRDEYQRKRSDLSNDELEYLNEQILSLLISIIKTLHPRYVHSFLPIIGSSEINTFRIINKIQENLPDASIVSPYIVPKTKNLRHFLFSDKLIINKWGIPEPDPIQSEMINPKDIDVVLVPLLIFDQKGYRVGYGGGFYDRFLVTCRPDVIKIGLSIFEAIESIENINQYDIRLDLCVTPNKVWEWRD